MKTDKELIEALAEIAGFKNISINPMTGNMLAEGGDDSGYVPNYLDDLEGLSHQRKLREKLFPEEDGRAYDCYIDYLEDSTEESRRVSSWGVPHTNWKAVIQATPREHAIALIRMLEDNKKAEEELDSEPEIVNVEEQ